MCTTSVIEAISPEMQHIISMITEPDLNAFCPVQSDSKKVPSKQHAQDMASESEDHPLVARREA